MRLRVAMQRLPGHGLPFAGRKVLFYTPFPVRREIDPPFLDGRNRGCGSTAGLHSDQQCPGTGDAVRFTHPHIEAPLVMLEKVARTNERGA